jgi:hypothetical protein
MLFLSLTAFNGPDVCSTHTSLGNVLFQLVFQYSICKKYNITSDYYFLNQFIKKLETFGLKTYNTTIFRNIYVNNNTEPIIDITLHESKHIYDEQLISEIIKNKDKNILIKDSYLQSHVYFNYYEDDIKNIFSPDETSLEFINNKYPQLKDAMFINISLHLRLEWNENLSYKSDYYKDSIEFFENKYKNSNTIINYFVFSDNINKAKDILSSLNKSFIYCKNNLDYIDLWIMSLCHHNIICHSTLGWWGAYLNKNKDKCVLYPSDKIQFLKKYYIINKNDLYIPKEWISIESTSIIFS